MSRFQSKDLYSLNFIPEVRDFICNGNTRIDQTVEYCALTRLPTIIVCPAVLKYHWQKIIENTTGTPAMVLPEYSANIQLATLPNFIIINYEQLEKYDLFLIAHQFNSVILDCSDYIKNLNSKRTQLVFKYFSNCPNRFCVSDMIFQKNHQQLHYYSQLKFLRPDFYTNMINIFRLHPAP